MKSHLTHHQHMNQSSSNFGFSAENKAAVSPIDLIDHPVEDQHSRQLDKSVIRRIASRGGRPLSMLIEKSISELKGLVWPEVRTP
ncbi:hypothetical protein VNO77_46384 [Canavalia gladiata]|uniref:Uncharacterized protein n=1 Tax=Canavalia gladiata TaxID=3824 RepID=A0AAN9JK76_CANGL